MYAKSYKFVQVFEWIIKHKKQIMEVLRSAWKLILDFSLFPLDVDEEKTCNSILKNDPLSMMCVMPTHHIDEYGRLKGFTYQCPSSSPISNLPLSRQTFFGHTACECDIDSHGIVALLSNVEQCRAKMKVFLQHLRSQSLENPVATFACMPDNAECTREGGYVSSITDKRAVDAQPWVPEMPNLVGIYHAFVRGHNRDTRVHKLFIIVSGGCAKASDDFYNHVLDCHGEATAGQCAMSQVSFVLACTHFITLLITYGPRFFMH